jgi:hypothetical protein
MHRRISWKNQKERHHYGNIDVDERIILDGF